MIDYRFEIAKEIALRDISVTYNYMPIIGVTFYDCRKNGHSIFIEIHNDELIRKYSFRKILAGAIEYHFERLAHV